MDYTLESCTHQLQFAWTHFIFVVISVLQLDELKPKAWKGGQDLMVLKLEREREILYILFIYNMC